MTVEFQLLTPATAAAARAVEEAPRRVQGRELRAFDGQPFVRAAVLAECRPGIECRVWAFGHWMRGEVVQALRTRVRVRLNPRREGRPTRTRDCEVREVWLRSTWPPGEGGTA